MAQQAFHLVHVFNKPSLFASCSGKNLANAPLHHCPGGVFGHPVGGEIHQSFAGPAVRPHSHHPSAYPDDKMLLHYHRDKMRKWLTVVCAERY